MRKLSRLTLVAALVLCSTTLFAQKFGYINTQELIAAMPERDSAQVKLQNYTKELGTQLESIQVEFNNKYQEYQKSMGSLTESVRQLKEKELQDLQTRYEEFQQMAQQDIQKMQAQLMGPVIERAENAIKKVGKANGFLVVFDQSSGAMAYFDEAMLTDVLPMVKKELGIVDKPASSASTTTPAAQ